MSMRSGIDRPQMPTGPQKCVPTRTRASQRNREDGLDDFGDLENLGSDLLMK